MKTSVVAFDTEIADLTDKLSDPVDVLFGCQLGGGTDINRALAYCQQLITRPTESILVLISDLYEGGIAEEMLRRVADLLRAVSRWWSCLHCRIRVHRRTTTSMPQPWLRLAYQPLPVLRICFRPAGRCGQQRRYRSGRQHCQCRRPAPLPSR